MLFIFVRTSSGMLFHLPIHVDLRRFMLKSCSTSTIFQLTVLNAGRKYLQAESLAGRVFLSSGLGGMSGAQAKAAVICGCVGIIAEVSALFQLLKQ